MFRPTFNVEMPRSFLGERMVTRDFSLPSDQPSMVMARR